MNRTCQHTFAHTRYGRWCCAKWYTVVVVPKEPADKIKKEMLAGGQTFLIRTAEFRIRRTTRKREYN